MDNQTILLVVVLVLIFLIWDQHQKNAAKSDSKTANGAEAPVGVTGASADDNEAKEGLSTGNALALLQDKIKNPEKYAQMEQLEGFAVCRDPNEVNKVLDCVCGDDPATTFAQHDYGKPGLDYKAYVTSQAVDAAVIHNHLQFVHGPNGAYSTGRTYSPDSHESYDPIPWIGLRRPEYVVQCNPTQVPDVNLDMYKRNRQFCFQT